MLLGAVICAPANVTLMNLTFEESDAAYGMPLYQAIILLATMVSGGLFYNEFSTWIDEVTAAGEPGWIVGFVTGIVTLVMGIVLVATTRGSHVVGGEEPTPRGATKPCYTALV
uniref:Uncharacterized protein n=1 Tax=Haptolina brevifila TaxID=156173 RepID=A0A7S2G132_9EUKA